MLNTPSATTPQENMAAKNTNPGRGRSTYTNTGSGNRFTGIRGGPNGGRSRGRGRTGGGSRPTCQICGKYGHSAAVCYSRYEESHMGGDSGGTQQQQFKTNPNAFIAGPEVVDSDLWFADSGASNHTTADASVMNQKQENGGQGNKEGFAPRGA
ncbi:cold shock domain-containing protein 4-like [Humulus lupulus]|uniref:cold shock domain-containing protein 4-like n=1 Tax=Humulus lupulus TaxID=3486 RepID=UPI002B406D02|nr:cold shock domain-containing protein 4-like [Humulus lupulus]